LIDTNLFSREKPTDMGLPLQDVNTHQAEFLALIGSADRPARRGDQSPLAHAFGQRKYHHRPRLLPKGRPARQRQQQRHNSAMAAHRSPNQPPLTAISPNFSKNNYRFFSQKGKNRRLMPESTISSNDL